MDSNDFNLRSLIGDYLKHWKWFLVSVIILVSLAYTHIRYSIPEYSATSKIQILEDKSASSELNVLEDLDLFSGGKTKIEDEIQLLKSRSNFIDVVRKLKLNIRYVVLGNIKNKELYKTKLPFNINFLASDSLLENSTLEFFIKLESKTNLLYSEFEESIGKSYSFGSNIKTKVGDLILIPNTEYLDSHINQTIKVSILPVGKIAQDYQSKILIEPAEKLSNIINITLTDQIKQRAIDVIDKLVDVNNANAVNDKRAIADKTSKFIDDRINEIYTSLSSVDESAETFKTNRGIADLGSQSNVNFSQSAAGEQQLQQANIQLSIAGSMQNMLENQEGYDVIPAVGLSDPNIDNTATKYNELVAQRNRLLESSNEKNPVIVKLDQQLEGLKRGMQSSLNNVTNNLNLQVNSLSKQLSQINSRIYAAPSNERALRDISRKQQTTESLYLYLLQKREESQITFASASPKSKIIDYSYLPSPYPVSPKPKVIYLAAFILGLLIPFSVIYLYNLLDNKIHNKIGLENIIGDSNPVLAEIPRLGKKDNKLVSRIDRSVLGESLRILRTNLDYILKSNNNSNVGKVILVTSSVSGEGKTFLSSNLAMIFASTRKKILLIGADIRNPKLYNFYEDLKGDSKSNNHRRSDIDGLTEYLFDDEIGLKNIIRSVSVNDNSIDVIYSGQIPPNPSELLMSKKIKNLFDDVKNTYDYIIVDTAPLLVVTDTLLISENADHIIYVTKAGVTEEKVLQYPIRLIKEGKLKNLSFVVNNVKSSELGYGGKYGYGYGQKSKKWWQFFSKN